MTMDRTSYTRAIDRDMGSQYFKIPIMGDAAVCQGASKCSLLSGHPHDLIDQCMKLELLPGSDRERLCQNKLLSFHC